LFSPKPDTVKNTAQKWWHLQTEGMVSGYGIANDARIQHIN